ncbi:MAG: hypothetical protein ACYCYO_22295 [Bacilli bacterium]
MTIDKEDFHRLIDRIEDPIDLETAYMVVKSIVEHDDQAWYWTECWQIGEREADTDKSSGRVSRIYDTPDALMADLMRESENDPASRNFKQGSEKLPTWHPHE